jgi:hypothetical protein
MNEQLEWAEEWLPAVGFEGRYEVSNLGRVRSIARTATFSDGRLYAHKGRLRCLTIGAGGYLYISLATQGKPRAVRVHQMVAAAFLGPRPPGTQVDHKDGNKLNNAAYNLRYLNAAENKPRGEKHGSAKLRREDIIEIRRLSIEGVSLRALGRQFGVSKTSIYRIIKRKVWKEVGND